VQAQFAQSRLLTSGMQAFLFDDNTIRIDWFLATALGFVKLRARLSAARQHSFSFRSTHFLELRVPLRFSRRGSI